DGQYGGGVVPVDLFGRNAVTDALVRKCRRGGLFVQRHRDRVLVVLHEEHHRDSADRGEVQRLVEVALTGATVAGESHDDVPVTPATQGSSHTDGVGQLRRQRGALRSDPHRVWIVATVPSSPQQFEHFGGLHPVCDQ